MHAFEIKIAIYSEYFLIGMHNKSFLTIKKTDFADEFTFENDFYVH
jgi:hypothetical protein